MSGTDRSAVVYRPAEAPAGRAMSVLAILAVAFLAFLAGTPRNLVAAKQLGIRTILIGPGEEAPDFADAIVARATLLPRVLEGCQAHDEE